MKFAVMDWNYAERLGRKVAMQVLEDSFRSKKNNCTVEPRGKHISASAKFREFSR
jgi:hypothetical protein